MRWQFQRYPTPNVAVSSAPGERSALTYQRGFVALVRLDSRLEDLTAEGQIPPPRLPLARNPPNTTQLDRLTDVDKLEIYS
jgi:hypothetical protein